MTVNPENPARTYVAAPLVQHILDLIRWHGLPAEQALLRLGLTREDINPPGGRLPMETAQRMLHLALELSGDPQMFLRLSKITFTNGYGVVGHLLQTCPTLGDCIGSLTRFEPLISNIGVSSMQYRPGQVLWGLDIHYPDAELVRQLTEFSIGVRYRFLLLADEKRSNIVQAIHFRHASPTSTPGLQAYADVFNCPVHFGQAENALVLAAYALKVPMRQPDSALKEAVEKQAEKKMGELEKTSVTFLDQVRNELLSLLQTGQASREKLAERLGISSRHLGRQLDNAGIGYRQILDELRMENARELLTGSARTIDEIGERLGFSDGQSFSRWFRQATNRTPGEFRQNPDS